MSLALKNTPATNAANENHQLPAGQMAINAMREQLGKSSAESRYSKLSDQQKAMILFGARLKPSEHIHNSLDKFSHEEKERIRKSILALCELSRYFFNIPLGKADFKAERKAKLKTVEPVSIEVNQEKEVDELSEVNRLVADLRAEMQELKIQ